MNPDEVIRYLKNKTGIKLKHADLLAIIKNMDHGRRADLKY